MISKHAVVRASALALSALAPLLLSGCAGMVKFPSVANEAVAGTALKGHVHGGQQPVAGAAILLYAAGTTGYSGTSTSLLTAGQPGVVTNSGGNYVLTDSSGNFSITGDYSCPSANSQIYIIAFGGNPGLAPGTVNGALSFAAALGSCAALNNNTFIHMNEVTTVAAAYALAPFVNLSFNTVTTSATNTVGMANAFVTANNIVNVGTGVAYSASAANAAAIPPQAKINLLANILSTCVNSDGTGTACQKLFAAATLPGSTTPPTTTAQAALNIALHPLNNADAIWQLRPTPGPFQPSLNAEPSDWTLSVQYPIDTTNGLAAQAMAIDSVGNVWLPSTTTKVSKLNTFGAPVAGSPFSVAGLNPSLSSSVDQQDSIWFGGNTGTYLFARVSPAGVVQANFRTGGGDAGFQALGVATDSASNVFFTLNYQPSASFSLQKFSSLGAALPPGNYNQGGGLTNMPFSALTINPSGQAVSLVQCQQNCPAASNSNQGGFAVFSNTGAPVSPSTGYLIGSANAVPLQFVLDAQGNDWISGSFGGASLGKTSQTGTVLVAAPATVGTGNLAIDGLNTIWTSDQFGNLTQLDTTGKILSAEGTLRTAYGQDITGVNGTTQIAIDRSGNLWRADYSGNAYEFIGLAAPVVTPLSKAAATNAIGSRP